MSDDVLLHLYATGDDGSEVKVENQPTLIAPTKQGLDEYVRKFESDSAPHVTVRYAALTKDQGGLLASYSVPLRRRKDGE